MSVAQLYAIGMENNSKINNSVNQKEIIQLPPLQRNILEGNFKSVKNYLEMIPNHKRISFVNRKDTLTKIAPPLFYLAMNSLADKDPALYKDKLELAEYLLQNGADPNISFRFGKEITYPLHIAAVENQRDLVTLLIKYEADINMQNSTGTTALHKVIAASHNGVIYHELESMIKLLLTHHANQELKTDFFLGDKDNEGNDIVVSFTAYELAAIYKNKSRNYTVELGNENKNYDLVSLLINWQNHNQETLLHKAVRQKNKNKIDQLLTLDANVSLKNKFKYNPFLLAIKLGEMDIIDLFLKYDRVKKLIQKESFFYLYIATKTKENAITSDNNNDQQTLELKEKINIIIDKLLANGADINNKKNGNSILLRQCKENNLSVVMLLLEKKDININCINNDGYSPIDYAIQHANFAMIDSLLKKGAQLIRLSQALILSKSFKDRKKEITDFLKNYNIHLDSLIENSLRQ